MEVWQIFIYKVITMLNILRHFVLLTTTCIQMFAKCDRLGQLLQVVVTDVSTASAAAILRVKCRVSVRFNQTHKQTNLTDILHLTAAAEAVETSVTTTCNSLSQDYTNLDDHISQTSTDTPRFKPFTLLHLHLLYIN